MIKTVNINARIPVKTITPPIQGYHAGIKMSSGDILKCLTRRAIVDEVLDDGTTVRLNMRNYFTDNNKKHVETVEKTKTVEQNVVETMAESIEVKPVVSEEVEKQDNTVVEVSCDTEENTMISESIDESTSNDVEPNTDEVKTEDETTTTDTAVTNDNITVESADIDSVTPDIVDHEDAPVVEDNSNTQGNDSNIPVRNRKKK